MNFLHTIFKAVLVLAIAPLCAQADTLDDIRAHGRMTVAIDPTFAPYEYTDSTGAIIGYTPEIMAMVARKLGVTIDSQKMAFDGIIPGLLAGSFDVEGSSLNVTAERARRVLFTVPFGKGVNGVLTRKDEKRVPEVSTIESLAGTTALVKAGAAPEKLIQEFNRALEKKKLAPIKVLSLDTIEQMVTALRGGRGDFVFDDIAVLGQALQQDSGDLRMAGELGPTQWMAWATRLDDTRLNKAISDVILELQASGQLAVLQKKYLGVSFTVPAGGFIPGQ